MIFIETNKDNSDYLVIGRFDVAKLVLVDGKVPNNIKKLADEMYSKIFSFEYEKKKHISEISIRKDSEIGGYLLNTNDIKVVNDDTTVLYEKVVNAFNIAVFDGNAISQQLLPLFRNQISGYRSELIDEYSEETIDYILSNSNFDEHLEKLEEGYVYTPKDYVIYENNEFSIGKLAPNINNQKMKVKK